MRTKMRSTRRFHHGFRRRPGQGAPWPVIRLLLAALGLLSGGMGTRTAAQLQFTGQVAGAYLQSGNTGQSQYVVDNGRGTFTSRLDLFGDAVISENVTFRSALRILQDQAIHIDQAALQVSDVTPLRLTFEAGVIDLPFGDLGDRRYPMKNPFLDLPLMNEHLTTLRTTDAQLWPFDNRYIAGGNGIRLLDQGLYDVGVKVSSDIDIVDLSVALMNGSVSSSSMYSGGGLDPGTGIGGVARCSVTPAECFTAGISYAHGYLYGAPPVYAYSVAENGPSFPQNSYEADVSFSVDHVQVYGQVLYSVWDMTERIGADLNAWAYSVEAQYVFLPRWTVSARAGALQFNTITTTIQGPAYQPVIFNDRWDADVYRYEGALGYRCDRSVLVKLVYVWTAEGNIPSRAVTPLVAAQAVCSF